MKLFHARLMLRGILAIVAASALLASPAYGKSDSHSFTSHIDLPDGFRPEGIAIGKGSTFFVGSIPTGALFRGNLRTGSGRIISPGGEGASAIGLAVDQENRVFAAGGSTGQARVIDGSTGEVLATYQLTSGSTFINDVVVTKEAAFFTDSVNPVLYRVPTNLGPASTIELSGDIQYQEGFNVNGIDATPNGKVLMLVQSNAGRVFTANPANGMTEQVDLGEASVVNGDGLLLEGRTLYVVRNQENLVVVIRMRSSLDSGRIVEEISNPDFDVPTTIDRFGSRLYVVNARFTTTPQPSTPYWISGFRSRNARFVRARSGRNSFHRCRAPECSSDGHRSGSDKRRSKSARFE